MNNESFLVICPICGIKNRVPLDKLSRKALCGKCHKLLITDNANIDAQPVEVNDTNFINVISHDTGIILVDFWAPWCGPCKSLAPIIDKLASEYAGKVKFAKLNVDENPRIASQYNIHSIPSMLIFNNGKHIDTIVGAVSKTEIMRHIEAIK